MGDNVYLGDRNGCARRCNGAPTATPGFPRPIRSSFTCRSSIDPEYHYEAINVENQQKNLSSMLWWTRRVIAMRKNFKAFSRGTLEFLLPENAKVLAFIRQHGDETILVVVNLSRFAQPAELDLSRFAGHSVMEVFSQNYFPAVTDKLYPITLGPHAYYWFALKPQRAAVAASSERHIPTLTAPAELGRPAPERPAAAPGA